MKIAKEVTIEQAKKIASQSKLLRYGANTCWWGMDDDPWYNTKTDGSGLPCDPRGGMLFETTHPIDFIHAAEEHVKGGGTTYGKHGLRTFLLALHGCVVTDNGKPTCFQTWKQYEDLIAELTDFAANDLRWRRH